MGCSGEPFYQPAVQKMEKKLILVHDALECHGSFAAVADAPTLEKPLPSSLFLPDSAERFIGRRIGPAPCSHPL
jgi:hypothetical protein